MSKWGVYSRPYVTLFALVIIGITIGWAGTYGVYTLTQPSPAVVNNANEESKADTTVSSVQNDNASESLSVQEVNEAPTTLTNDSNNQTSNPAQNTPQVIASSDNVSQVQTNDIQNNDEDTANGLTLEDGQIVLGYQPNNPQSNDQSSPTPNIELPSNDITTEQITEEPDEVNQELLRRIQQVALEVDNNSNTDTQPSVNVTDLTALPRIDQLSSTLLSRMPSMSFSAHMYASNPQDRWVRVNSRRVGEGEYIANNLFIKSIEPEQVVLNLDGTEFTMNALSDW